MRFSVVIPIKNEEESILALIEEIEQVMNSLDSTWELICIDDGSTDETLALLQQLSKEKAYIRVLVFTKNFGQSAAFAAGFEAARGEYVITLDADGQNDPADIPKLTAAIGEVDLVSGWRVDRQDTWQKKWISRLANEVRGRFCHDGMHDTGCSLKVYRKSALKKIKMYKGMHRFLPALFKIEGFKVKEVPVSHRMRTKGITKYNFFNRSVGPLVDMLVVRWMHKRALRHQIREEISHDSFKK